MYYLIVLSFLSQIWLFNCQETVTDSTDFKQEQKDAEDKAQAERRWSEEAQFVEEEGILLGKVKSAPLEDFNLHAGPREPRGWGSEYDWVNFLDAVIEGSESKPILLVLHDYQCDDDVHCREIRKEFAASKELIAISQHFHMINQKDLSEHNQHWDTLITNPWYTPRFFFLEAHGDVIPWAQNRFRKDNKLYYYNHAKEIVATAKEVYEGYYKKKHDEL